MMPSKRKVRELKHALIVLTNCGVQHDGWPCGTCFFAVDKEFTEQDWQAVLLVRGDYAREDLDNLPPNIEESVDKILRRAGWLLPAGVDR